MEFKPEDKEVFTEISFSDIDILTDVLMEVSRYTTFGQGLNPFRATVEVTINTTQKLNHCFTAKYRGEFTIQNKLTFATEDEKVYLMQLVITQAIQEVKRKLKKALGIDFEGQFLCPTKEEVLNTYVDKLEDLN